MLRQAVKRRGATLALNGLDLDIRPGQCVALLGPNGAGKSTSVALLTGRLRPDAGTASLFGGDPRDVAARGRMGVMLQEAGLPRTLTVREQIDLFRGYYRQPRPLDEIIRLAGLEGLERRRCGALSGGQQRRVQFALAIAGRPDFLVLDEPTTGMDIEARRALWATTWTRPSPWPIGSWSSTMARSSPTAAPRRSRARSPASPSAAAPACRTPSSRASPGSLASVATAARSRC
jgi:ABC-2 type transport system ATP-binding protein